MNSDSGGRDSNSRPTSWSRKRLNDDVYNNTQRQTKIPFKKGVIQSQSFNVDNVKGKRFSFRVTAESWGWLRCGRGAYKALNSESVMH